MKPLAVMPEVFFMLIKQIRKGLSFKDFEIDRKILPLYNKNDTRVKSLKIRCVCTGVRV